MKIHIEIKDKLKVSRLDTVISNFVDTCARSRAAAIISKGEILVNNIKKKPGYKLKDGDLITGVVHDIQNDNSILPENIILDIIFEDDQIIVINKQPGMVIHPAPGNYSGTLVNALLFYNPGIKKTCEDQFRPGIVHRLDKDTSGLIVVAKTKHALNFLQKEFKHRRVEKKYLALVTGDIAMDKGAIDLPIGRHPVKRKLMAINHEEGKYARTCWEVKKHFKTACLVEALLKTGRTHQIRVHFYAIDHPLIGDLVYQPRRFRKKKSIAPRQMLHSWKLSFRHPYSGEKVTFESEIPEDFIQTQALLESVQ
jgi:23S rRNA pseudouridine1911/1915/1917 synthase